MPVNESQVKKFKQKITEQLKEAKQQKLFWIKKEIALEGSLAACEHILKEAENKSTKGVKK